jgi:tetratricopeptide (TPR) repeat protein
MDYTELFDRYIDGQLEGKELEDFNKKLDTDIQFRKTLEQYIRLNNVSAEVISNRVTSDKEFQINDETDKLSLEDISKYGRDRRGAPDEQTTAFKEMLDRTEKEISNKVSWSFKKNLPIRFAIAATVIVAILVTLFIIIRQNKITTGDLFTLYYSPYVETEEVFEITRSSDNFYYALKVFEAGDYARAAVLFEELSDTVELKVYAIFYSGLTCMQMGKWEEAVKKLEEVLGYGETRVSEPARWYLGLCFLRLDDSKSARKQFEILASAKNEYSIKSRRILRLMH